MGVKISGSLAMDRSSHPRSSPIALASCTPHARPDPPSRPRRLVLTRARTVHRSRAGAPSPAHGPAVSLVTYRLPRREDPAARRSSWARAERKTPLARRPTLLMSASPRGRPTRPPGWRGQQVRDVDGAALERFSSKADRARIGAEAGPNGDEEKCSTGGARTVRPSRGLAGRRGARGFSPETRGASDDSRPDRLGPRRLRGESSSGYPPR